jgi:hypothetical protein
MKNDPIFKLVAVVIIAGVILAFASPKTPNGVQLTSTTHAHAPVTAVSYHS